MSQVTDAFDIVIQVREEVIQQILQAQHRAELLRHRYVRVYQDKRIELLLNSPTLLLVTDPQPDQLARVRMTSRIHYRSRDLATAGDLGTTAAADVTVRAALRLSTGDPGQLVDTASLNVDWQETGHQDIVVHGVVASDANEVRDALLDFIRDYRGGRYVIPSIGSPGQRVGSLAFRFLAGSNGMRVLVVGMNVGNVVKGDKTGIQQVFVQQDWAMALSNDFMLREIRDSLRNHFGNRLPPPHGSTPVQVSDQEVCTLPGPFGNCIDHSRQRVFVDHLDVSLQTGAIVFTGRLRVTTSAFYVPDIGANFTVPVTLSIETNQSLQISVGRTEVDVTGVFADIANFLSGGAIETIIKNGVQSALQTSLQQGQISGFFSSELLNQFASLGGTADLGITSRATSVEIRSDALIMHGEVTVMNRSAQPHAAFVSLRPENALTRRILHAGPSWAPGGRITEYHWDFGDGQSERSAGDTTRFVTEHDYQPGVYNTCLTVSDDLGRTRTACVSLATATLSLRHTPVQYEEHTLSPWHVCQTTDPIDVEFAVFDEQTPVRDALVRVEGREGYQFEDYTDQQGRISFRIDLTNDHARSDGSGRGFMIIRASKDGYVSASFATLYFVDCELLFAPIDRSREALAELFERFQELPDLTGPDIPPGPDGPWPPIESELDSYKRRVGDVGLALDVLTKLILLLERDPEILQIEPFLGIDNVEGESIKALEQRFEEGLSTISEALDGLHEERHRL
jgi:PKD domain